jgi:hypothetical protein
MATHPHSTLELNWFGCETSNILLPEVKYQGMHMHPSTPWCNGWHLKCTLAGLANVLNNASSNAIGRRSHTDWTSVLSQMLVFYYRQATLKKPETESRNLHATMIVTSFLIWGWGGVGWVRLG